MQKLNAIQNFAIWVLPVLFAITVHEAAHGWIALKFGDKTAKMLGRLTLNPFKHIDMLGTVIVPIATFMLSGFVFGWAKPVPVTWQNLRNPKRDMIFVALAGPGANILMALFWALIAKLGVALYSGMPTPALALVYMGRAGILINLVLMVLNLIPIPPLDGSRVVSGLIPNRWSYHYNKLEPYGFFILLGLIFTGLLFRIMWLPVITLAKLINAAFGLPFF